MDIEILLWFQSLRLALGPVVQAAVAFVSDLASGTVLVGLLLVVYWCLDKALGQELGFAYCLSFLANQTLKNTFCCQRPWVRDQRIRPASQALAHATGYSFPSGHSQTAGSVFGGIGMSPRVRRPLRVLCWAMAVVIPVSRCYLGVHTPQDVVVGLAEGLVGVLLARALLAWAERGERHDAACVAAGLLLVTAFIAYVTLKPYPADVADGLAAAGTTDKVVDCYKGGGIVAGLLVGWLLEGRLVRFSTDGLCRPERLMRAVVGLVCVGAVQLLLKRPLVALLGLWWGEFVKNGLLAITGLFVAPAVFSAIGRRVWHDGGKGAELAGEHDGQA
jgi:membrane-associated phospholipid phosphatase